MIIELGNKKEIEYLYYKINNEEFNFYYKDVLLYQNNKTSPFLSIILENDGLKKEIPLYNCDIKKEAENKFLIEFYNKNYRVKSRVILKNNLINIYITKKENYLIKMSFINKESNKIVGFGCNNIENWQGKYLALKDKEVQDINKVIIEKKLCFYMKNKYLFYNKNIKDWAVNIERDVVIYTTQNEIFFALQVDEVKEIFADAYREEVEKKYIKSDNILGIKELKYYDGIILKNSRFEKQKIIDYSFVYSKNNKKIIMEITPYFSNKSRIFEVLGQDEKILIHSSKNGEYYTYNFENSETIRKIKNIFRSYLDSNIDGFYSVEKIVDKSNIYYHKEYGKVWKKTIEEVFKEYPSKTLIYDKLEEKKINGIYKIPLNKYTKNKDSFKYSLICSGIYEVMYEDGGIISNK